MNKRLVCLGTLFLIVLLGVCGCAGKKQSGTITGTDTGIEAYDDGAQQPDSLERVNRKIFSFNDFFLTYAFTPINTVYVGLFPPYVRDGFSNFYTNLTFPSRFVNALLQFKFVKMGQETASFALNTVFGVGGLFKITRNMEALQASPEDFGQTLAFYGLGHGSYFVLPVAGPSSLRDTCGLVVDSFLHPLAWLNAGAYRTPLTVHDAGNKISANLGAYEAIKADSFDHYTSLKDVYFQHRTSLEGQ